MRTILVTGSDTNVGKTHVVAALARMLANSTLRDRQRADVPESPDRALAPVGQASSSSPDRSVNSGAPGEEWSRRNAAPHAAADPAVIQDRAPRVQIVKVVETGRDGVADNHGDAATARRLSGVMVEAFTLASYPKPIAPASAAVAMGQAVSFTALVAAVSALPPCDWRILEGAGGVATPLDSESHDWADFAQEVGVDAIVVVVPDRLGAINQGRLAYARAVQAGAPTGLWLNAPAPVDAEVAMSSRAGLRAAGIPIWADQRFGEVSPVDVEACGEAIGLASGPMAPSPEYRRPEAPGVLDRCRAVLADRDERSLRRALRVTVRRPDVLNLADNDYLELARDPAVAAAVAAAARDYGTSASASPLITGWGELHARLTERLASWHGFACGLLWSSGYAANSAVLGGLPERGDLVLADRLIHASMIAGLRQSGARLQRYEHLRLDRLEPLLADARSADRQVFVVTESVFSMDGDYPDLARMAELKRRYGFFWVVDEAHALGWFGPQGAGLVGAAGAASEVDVLVGTFGKTLAAGGAYALFQSTTVRDYLVNTAGEFIYSTALPPTNAAAAAAALDRVIALAPQQREWHAASRDFRHRLRDSGWQVPEGDSPILPVVLNDAAAALELADALRQAGIIASAIRPPTVPIGTSRLRFSLKRSFGRADADRVLVAMNAWRAAR